MSETVTSPSKCLACGYDGKNPPSWWDAAKHWHGIVFNWDGDCSSCGVVWWEHELERLHQRNAVLAEQVESLTEDRIELEKLRRKVRDQEVGGGPHSHRRAVEGMEENEADRRGSWTPDDDEPERQGCDECEVRRPCSTHDRGDDDD